MTYLKELIPYEVLEFLSHCGNYWERQIIKICNYNSYFKFVLNDIKRNMVMVALTYLKTVRKRRDSLFLFFFFFKFQELPLVTKEERGEGRGK